MTLARLALAAGQRALPAYSHRYSPRKFTQAQLFALLALKQFFKLDYRGLVTWVGEWAELRQALGLNSVLHYSTLCYAEQRLLKKSPDVDRLFQATPAWARQQGRLGPRSELAAIDGTGLESRHVSHYDSRRCRRRQRRFPKVQTVIDVRSHLCLAAVVERGPKPDDLAFRRLAAQAHRRQPYRAWLGDAGYDGEEHHRFLDRRLHVLGIIPPRRGRRGRQPPATLYRGLWAELWPRLTHLYHQRWQIESHFSQHKRLLGSALRAHRSPAQTREIFLRLLTLNLMILLWPWWLFNRAVPPVFRVAKPGGTWR